TVALDPMAFIRPVKVGDILGVYTEITDVGRTSMNVHVEAWVRRRRIGSREKVTSAVFKFVALDEQGKPTQVPDENDLPDYVNDVFF
ncbi:MAG: hotdog domain-containing protein, partial [Kangiellaceae bacterium]